MMPTIFSSYSWIAKAIAVAALVGAVIFGFYAFSQREQLIGYNKAAAVYEKKIADMQSQTNKQLLIAQKAVADKQVELNANVQKAENDATQRNQKIEALTARVNALNKRLRDTITARQRTIDTATSAARSEYTRTLGELLTECADKYSEMARAADQERSDSLKYQEAWPK